MDWLPLLVLFGGTGLAAWWMYRGMGAPALFPADTSAGVDQDPSVSPVSEPAGWPSTQVSQVSAPVSSTSSSPAPIVLANSVSPAGQARIKQFEGLKLTRYGDAGHYDIGYGHQLQPGENFTTITPSIAEQLFQSDVSAIETAMNSVITTELTQNEYDAIADLIYNIGIDAFRNSTMLKYLNAGDISAAQTQFPQWVHSSGVVNANLVARRRSDAALFGSA